MDNDTRYKIIIKKSVQDANEKRYNTKINFSIKRKTLAKIAVTIILVSALGKGVSYLIDRSNQKEALETHSAGVIAVVDDAREVGNYDIKNNKPRIDHDSGKIAEYLVENKDDFDIKFYEVYKEIVSESAYSDDEVRTIMNNVLNDVAALTKDSDKPIIYNSFESYVKGFNFTDKDGNANYKMYDRYMMGVVYQLQQANDQLEQMGMKGRG